MQHLNNNNNNNNKLKLLVSHSAKGSRDDHFSLLSTEKEEDGHNCVTFHNYYPCFGDPIASCHELVLILADCKNDEPLALSPSTNKVIKALPQAPRPPPSVEYIEYVKFYGLGLDPKTDDDYKVIRNLEFKYEDNRFWSYEYDWITELYSLNTDSSKQIVCPHTYECSPCDLTPIYINGFNYWLVSTGNCGEDVAIMSFDFAKECFPSALIPGPCAATYKHGDSYEFLLAEYEGSLAVVVYLVKDELFELWVWNNDYYNQSWSRRGEWAIPKSAVVCCPLGLYKNDQFYFKDSVGELVLFDCAKKELKNLGLYDSFCAMSILPYCNKEMDGKGTQGRKEADRV